MSDNILLVEDDPDSQDLVRALCAAQGYGVDIAGDGFLGLRLLSERRHAIVLIDYHLPEMDGFALARLMREIVGAQGRLKLVGVTADRHGLESRRGADSLFDAILVKPLDPALLYATLEKLKQPDEATTVAEKVAPTTPAGVGHAADALWRRRGLPGRPRAALCPDVGPDMSAAVGEAFELCAVETADLILVATPEGLNGLRAMRTAGPGRFLPAVDLDGRLGQPCDLVFRVSDAEAWTRLAKLCLTFASRRASLRAEIRQAEDPATQLLAFLYVRDRALPLSACADPSAAITEIGLSRAALMSAVLTLTETGLAVCDAALDGVVVRLTESGGQAATRGLNAAMSRDLGPWTFHGARPSLALGRLTSTTPCATLDPSSEDPIVDHGRVETLRGLIGEAELARLRDNLLMRLRGAFPTDAHRTSLAHETHALIAMSGSLGFFRLSTACRELETALSRNVDGADALRRAKRAVGQVLDLYR